MLDQVGAEAAHRRVLLAAVAVGHDDGGVHAMTCRGEGDGLAVVAAGGADHPARSFRLLAEALEIHQPATQLEGTHRRVVLVLDPGFATQRLAEQRPAELRGGWQAGVDDGGGLFQ
ncbi:hypothetical protein D3C78_1481750 [compost metagenome]